MGRLGTIKTISKTLNVETDLSTMLQLVLESLLDETDFSSGWIFLIDRSGMHHLYAHAGLPPALARDDCAPLKAGGCWCKTDFLHGKLNSAVNMLRCQRLERAEERNWGKTTGITHHATIPIYAGEEALGILNIAHPRKTYFANEELELLELVALQIGTAIKRVELVKKEYDRAHLYSQLGLFLQELHHTTKRSKEDLLHLIHTFFPFTQFVLSISDTLPNGVAGETYLRLTPSREVTDIQAEITNHIAAHLALSFERDRIEAATKELTEMNERQRLSRELHDSVNQLLFSVNMTIGGLTLRTKEHTTKERLEETSVLVNAALNELKAIIRGYRGEDLDNGLFYAITQYTHLIKLNAKVEIIEPLELPSKIEGALYRIAQEALNNCKKHAQSDSVHISLNYQEKTLCLTICDNGVGFNENKPNYSFGLSSIYKRADELGGVATLKSKPGKGTQWSITIPYDRSVIHNETGNS
ncbi:GAF domain-containing sensor histidine kinase [Shouchella patagoniensis]|uniref:GAF domain-containing sensor histidine kinase n=1 Tax=Shouchella patagoniensis TaxID=228576 RepID=UPI000994C36F|nr:GAF domain-containing sensor histidine kinase [Shouchella patagoniensis]